MTAGIGIETSCDETSIGIVKNGTEILSLKVFSQIELHAEYNGIVPEIASRAHLEKINFLLEESMAEAGIGFDQIDYIATTAWPGLTGSLMIGAQLARTMGMVLKKPVIAIDHLEAHLTAVRLENKFPEFPVLGVLLSGGNSSIFTIKDFGQMEKIADTKDDAIGEAFDKVASILGLGYPGGPVVEKKAAMYIPKKKEKPLFPEILKEDKGISFSFSGIKTAVLYYIRKNTLTEEKIHEICYHFQNSVFNLVERNIVKAARQTGINKIICAGGVMANETLAKRLKLLSAKENLELYYPEKKILCMDNGAMVASLGYYYHKMKKNSGLSFRVSPVRRNS